MKLNWKPEDFFTTLAFIDQQSHVLDMLARQSEKPLHLTNDQKVAAQGMLLLIQARAERMIHLIG